MSAVYTRIIEKWWQFIQCKLPIIVRVLKLLAICTKFTLIPFQSSPQKFWWNFPPYPQSPSACLPELKLEHQPMVLGGRGGKSRLLLQGEGSARKKWWSLGRILPQPEAPAGFKGGTLQAWVKSHPSCRKSSTGMEFSILGQLGELLDKAADIVPATLFWWAQEYVGGVLKLFGIYTYRVT